MSPRRDMTSAVVGSMAAGAMALIAGGQTWARLVTERPAPLPPVESTLSGAEAVPVVPAAGLVLLAAAVALPAVRGAARVAVGVLVAGAGGVLLWSGIGALGGGLGTAGARATEVDTSGSWPALAAVAGALAVAVGGLVVRRGRTWQGMGRRYERSGARTPGGLPPRQGSDEDRAQDAWKALDRGEDPTDGGPAAPRPEPSGTGSRVAPTQSAGEGTDVGQAGNSGDPNS